MNPRDGVFVLQWVIRALMLVSVVSAITTSLSLKSYTPETPKRLFLQHLIRVSSDGEQVPLYAAASSDATPVDVVLKGMNLTPAWPDGREWLVSTSCSLKVSLLVGDGSLLGSLCTS